MSNKRDQTTALRNPAINIGIIALCAVALIAIGVGMTDRPAGNAVGVQDAPDMSEVETEFETSIIEELPTDVELNGSAVTPDDTGVFVTPVAE